MIQDTLQNIDSISQQGTQAWLLVFIGNSIMFSK
jgi:hypothetical protein